MLKRMKLISIAAAFVVVLSGLALAHDNKDRDRYDGGSLDARQHGYEHGFRDGLHHGREDRERNASYNFKGDDYKKGDRGYEKYMGNKDTYKKGYREVYQAGYGDGYNRRSGRIRDIYGRSSDRDIDRDRDDRDGVYADRGWGYTDVAYDIGYRDGVDKGRSDANGNKSFDPERPDRYRDADHGYRDSYGDKEAYKRQYRDGFRRGYEDGFGRYERR